MFNDRGQPVVIAQPGAAVEVIGWRDLPSAGEDILEVDTEVRLTAHCTVGLFVVFYTPVTSQSILERSANNVCSYNSDSPLL